MCPGAHEEDGYQMADCQSSKVLPAETDFLRIMRVRWVIQIDVSGGEELTLYDEYNIIQKAESCGVMISAKACSSRFAIKSERLTFYGEYDIIQKAESCGGEAPKGGMRDE